MNFLYDGVSYRVVIVRKNNKNTYVRFKDNVVYVTTSYFTSKRFIQKLLLDHSVSIGKMIDKGSKRIQDDEFYLFGVLYQIIFDDRKDVFVDTFNKKIHVCDMKRLDRYVRDLAKDIFYQHLMKWYYCFEEDIPMPTLRIRKMKSRWGVCNIKSFVITLNLELIHYDLDCLDYVVVHELSHLLVSNHSKDFWKVVSKYCPCYKDVRKKLRNVC